MAKKAPAKKKEKEIVSKVKLVDKISKETEGITKKDITAVVNALMSVVVDSVRQGDEVRLVGFGTFKLLTETLVQVATLKRANLSKLRQAILSPLGLISDFNNKKDASLWKRPFC